MAAGCPICFLSIEGRNVVLEEKMSQNMVLINDFLFASIREISAGSLAWAYLLVSCCLLGANRLSGRLPVEDGQGGGKRMQHGNASPKNLPNPPKLWFRKGLGDLEFPRRRVICATFRIRDAILDKSERLQEAYAGPIFLANLPILSLLDLHLRHVHKTAHSA
jgi:hypothetical protein